jgi:hypothetical protein
MQGKAKTGLPADDEKPMDEKDRMAQGDGLPGEIIGDMAEDMSKGKRLIESRCHHPLRPP